MKTIFQLEIKDNKVDKKVTGFQYQVYWKVIHLQWYSHSSHYCSTKYYILVSMIRILFYIKTTLFDNESKWMNQNTL